MWSSIPQENSIDGYTRNLFFVLGCGRSEILNITLSRNAGSGSCIFVFSRTVIDPIFALNISFHLSICLSGGNSLQAHAIPFCFRSCMVS